MERIVKYQINEDYPAVMKELVSLIDKKDEEWKNLLGKKKELCLYEELKLLKKVHELLNFRANWLAKIG